MKPINHQEIGLDLGCGVVPLGVGRSSHLPAKPARPRREGPQVKPNFKRALTPLRRHPHETPISDTFDRRDGHTNAVLSTQSSPQPSNAGTQGVIHVLDVETGEDVVIPRADAEANELQPFFSPDGKTLLIERHGTDAAYEVGDGQLGYRLVVTPSDGSGSMRPMGPPHHSGTSGATVEFSPDGTQVLATYNEDDTTWILDIDGSGQEQLPFTGRNGTSWQRLAP